MTRHKRPAVTLLAAARRHFCGIGTRRTKFALNKLSRTSTFAKALRLALEIEDQNLTAKTYHGGDIGVYTYDQISDIRKHAGIMELVEVCEAQGWPFGIEKSVSFGVTHVIYFELPKVGQVSWHFSPPPDLGLPIYQGVWDQQQNSTLRKLENAIQLLLKIVPANECGRSVAPEVRQQVRLTDPIFIMS